MTLHAGLKKVVWIVLTAGLTCGATLIVASIGQCSPVEFAQRWAPAKELAKMKTDNDTAHAAIVQDVSTLRTSVNDIDDQTDLLLQVLVERIPVKQAKKNIEKKRAARAAAQP